VVGEPPEDAPWATSPSLRPWPSDDALARPDDGSLAAMAAHGVVVLNGEGGDEIWRTTVMTDLLGVEPWPALARGVFDTLRERRRPALGLNVRGRLRGTRKPIRPPAWLSAELARRFDFEAVLCAGDRLVKRPAAGPRSGSLQGLGTALWQTVLLDYDAPPDAPTLELRLPMLDVRVVKAALVLPPLPAVVDKLAEREAARGRLPAALVGRKKTGLVEAIDRREVRPRWDALPAADRLAYYVDARRLESDVTRDGMTWEAQRALVLWRWLSGGARRPDAR
jgi:asparagine synthetase B (glutamine-hydrolysing)